MAKNEIKKKKSNDKEFSTGLQAHTKHGILAVVFFVLALFFIMSYPVFNIGGVAGVFIYEKLHFLLGVGYILLPTLLVLLGSSYVKSEGLEVGWRSVTSGIIFLLSGLGVIDIISGAGVHAGGLLGTFLSIPLVSLFEVYASTIFLLALLVISLLIMFDAKLDPAPFLSLIHI